MPLTGYESSPKLRIELVEPNTVYHPGDRISGHVFVHVSQVQVEPRLPFLKIRLYGQAETRVIISRQNGKDIKRGRAVFFEENQMLHVGSTSDIDPVDESECFCAEFSFTIPNTSQPGFHLRGDEWKKEADSKCLSSREKDQVDLATHGLPSVMYYHSVSPVAGYEYEAYIEYLLVAENTCNRATTSMPLLVREVSTEMPIEQSEMDMISRISSQEVVKTHKLLPDFSDQDMTLNQQYQTLFRQSKIPRYTYRIRVQVPTVIQLEHHNPIPIKLTVFPDMEPMCTTISPADLPHVLFTGINLKITSTIELRTASAFGHSHTKTHHYPFVFPMALSRDGTANAIPTADPCSFKPPALSLINSGRLADQLATETSWDIGKALNIQLSASGASTQGHDLVAFKRMLYPTFATYNISVSHHLEWKIWTLCAGKEGSFSGTTPLTILQPSEEDEAISEHTLSVDGIPTNHDDMTAATESRLSVATTLVGSVRY